MASLKITSFLFASLFIFNSCITSYLKKNEHYKEVKNEEYSREIQNYKDTSTYNIIDIRTKKEYFKAHIEGADNASIMNKDFKEYLKGLNLDPTKPTYIYCETQHRSLFAAKILIEEFGYTNIIDLDRGLGKYRKKGLPYVTNDTLN